MKNRLEHIDAARGIGILLVVAGHLLAYASKPSCVIFSFHMPLFFVLSGLFAKTHKEHDFSGCFKKTFWQYMPPYLSIFAVGTVVTFALSNADGITLHDLLRDMYQGVPTLFHAGHLWFILCLAEVKIAFYLAEKYILSRKKLPLEIGLLIVVVAIGCTVWYFAPKLPTARLPLRLDTALVAFAFYLCGYYARHTVRDLPKMRTVYAVLLFVPCFAVTVFVSPVNGWVNMAALEFGNWALYYAFALIGITAVLLLGVFTSRSRFLRFLGRHSMIVYLLHPYFKYLYDAILRAAAKHTSVSLTRNGDTAIAYALIGTVFVMVCCLAAAGVYSKIMQAIQKRSDPICELS